MKYQPEEFELEKTTIWSFKERGNWATHRGDIVLDTFCGSGTTMIETKLLNRKGIRNRCKCRST